MLKKVQVGHRTYELVPVKMLPGTYGMCLASAGTILYDPNQPPLELYDTLVHELMHAAWHEACLEVGDDEERIVTVLSRFLSPILPKLTQAVLG